MIAAKGRDRCMNMRFTQQSVKQQRWFCCSHHVCKLSKKQFVWRLHSKPLGPTIRTSCFWHHHPPRDRPITERLMGPRAVNVSVKRAWQDDRSQDGKLSQQIYHVIYYNRQHPCGRRHMKAPWASVTVASCLVTQRPLWTVHRWRVGDGLSGGDSARLQSP